MNKSGYSGTPLAKKLGLKEDFKVVLIDPPKYYWKLFEIVPSGIHEISNPTEGTIDFIHLFCTTRIELKAHSAQCKSFLKKNGSLWVSWPKGSSKIPTDLKREPIREHLLSIGLVDVKVCAVDEDWSGLKFMYRITDR